jgi:hypothetical protein
MKAEIMIRSQHPIGGTNSFGGPDRYVAVVLRADDLPPWGGRPLRRDSLAKRGYTYRWIGEGYSHRTKTERSAYRQAISRARAYVAEAGATLDP